MSVLIIKDSQMESLSTRAQLERDGFKVEYADSAQQAIDRLKNDGIDAVLLDVSRADSTAIDLFELVRAQATGIPIVVLTVHDDRHLALQFVKMGAQDYLIKGVASDDSVVRCVRFAIERNRVNVAHRKGEERLKAILDNSYDAFISMDRLWKITDWNAEAERTFGFTKEQMLGQSFAFILPSHLRRQYLKDIEKYFAGTADHVLRMSRELSASHQDGHDFPIEIGIFRIIEDSNYRFCAFVRDITAKQKSNEELESIVHERTLRLTESNNELRQFAKIASHDLQEPLRAIEGFTALLSQRTRANLDKDCGEFIEYIADAAKRMKALIQSVLLHAQIQVDDQIEHVTDCNSVITEVLADLSETIKESGASFEIDRLPIVAVEHSQVAQLFQNLVCNSIKYRHSEPPQIEVTAERQLNRWLFSFHDNGMGIDPKYSDRIFDMFSRLHSKSQFPGTGIGLAICKKIITSHGGRIWVESNVDQGSVFLFTLPAIKKVRRSRMRNGIDILLAEDTPSDVRLTEEALKQSHLIYNIVIVDDGVEAMEYLTRLKESSSKFPDIILLDLNMPRMNGHEVLAEIKNDPSFKDIPVILLTVSERDEDVLEALKLRMNYYLAKPISSDKLTVLVRAIHELHTQHPPEASAPCDEETHIRLILAGNPHTSSIALARLAEDGNQQVRCRVAEHIRVPANALLKLATDSEPNVRVSVSENPNVPTNVLETLAKDPCDDVRLGLAGNPHIPKHLLEELEHDSNVFVAASAKSTLGSSPIRQT